MTDGQEVLVGTRESYLTAQEAANFLGVSRPTLIRVLDLGEIPFEWPNSHRRIRLADLVAYKAGRTRGRAALDELLSMSDDMAEHDGGSVPTRR